MKRSSLFLIILNFLAASLASGQSRSITSFPLARGVGISIEDGIDSALIKPYEKIVKEKAGKSEAAEAQLAIGLAYYEKKAFATALTQFRRVLDSPKQSTAVEDAHYYIADCYAQLHSDSISIVEAENFLVQHPRSKWADDATNLVALGYSHQGKSAQMIATYKKAVDGKGFKYRDQALLAIGRGYRLLKNSSEALKSFQEAASRGSSVQTKSQAQFEIGITYKILGQHDKALSGFETALAASSVAKARSLAQYEIANTYHSLKDRKRAIAEFQKIETLYPNEAEVPFASYRIGICLLEEKEFEAAIEQLKRMESMYPDFQHRDHVLYYISKAYFQTGRKDLGRQYLERLLQAYPASNLRKAAQKLMEW